MAVLVLLAVLGVIGSSMSSPVHSEETLLKEASKRQEDIVTPLSNDNAIISSKPMTRYILKIAKCDNTFLLYTALKGIRVVQNWINLVDLVAVHLMIIVPLQRGLIG